ncbi:ferredoxin [Streptomyces tirandamycinicus]|uniref:ferredoxin n=1 Tax=Streptomyces tirandamycinicus TaxID=2174846 RepID=UPI000380BFB5
MRITVDHESCVGAGQCVLSAPEIFDQDDDGIVTLLTAAPGTADRDVVFDAADLCPGRAITVHEERDAHELHET